MIVTHRSQIRVLKSSAIAGLLALDKEARDSLGSLENFHSVKERAKSLEVRLGEKNLILVEKTRYNAKPEEGPV